MLQRAADASWSAKIIPSGPAPVPAPPLAPADGYQAGMANGRAYYAKVSGAGIKFYLKSKAGKMMRVAAPGVAAAGPRFCPIVSGGAVLFPQIEKGQVTCYCIYEDGMEKPVLNAAAAPQWKQWIASRAQS